MPNVDRSPNYPRLSLQSSLEYAEALYKKEGMGEVPGAIAARAIGNESLNGAARAKIASMKQYGLLDGRGDKLRLTDRAFRILQSPDPQEVAAAKAEAALSPSLFADINASKPGASDEAIAYWLRRERKFSEDGARNAVKAYRDTTALLSLESGGHNKGHEEPEPEEKHDKNPPGSKTPTPHEERPGASRHNVTGLLLEGGTIAEIGFSGQPLTREGVDMLIDYLKLTRRALPPTVVPTATDAAPQSITTENQEGGE